MATHKKIFFFASWIILVAAVILSARGHNTHEVQTPPKYEIEHGGAVLPSITQRDPAPAEVERHVEKATPSVDTSTQDANGNLTKIKAHPPAHKIGKKKADKKVAAAKVKKHKSKMATPGKKKHDAGSSHSTSSGGNSDSGGSSQAPPSGGPLGSTFPAPPFSPAFGAFA